MGSLKQAKKCFELGCHMRFQISKQPRGMMKKWNVRGRDVWRQVAISTSGEGDRDRCNQEPAKQLL